jgi:hypothetical protein
MRLIHGDCLEVLPTLADASVDAVVTDPPYPCIDRAYGRWTEAEWWDLMMGVCREVRRVLKPTGSAVFVLQPNSRKVGSMRGWLFDFQSWACREWNIIQDAWWWNHTALAFTGDNPEGMRPSVKACVWCGPPECYRQAADVRWLESEGNRMRREEARCTNRLQKRPGGQTMRDARAREAAVRNGGVTPFNLLPIGADGKRGDVRHPGRTPLLLVQWWTRYICPPGGTVLDPFGGSGTAALAEGRDAILIEKEAEYVAIARRRIAEANGPLFTSGKE